LPRLRILSGGQYFIDRDDHPVCMDDLLVVGPQDFHVAPGDDAGGEKEGENKGQPQRRPGFHF